MRALSVAQAEELRRLYDTSGHTMLSLAHKYNVGTRTVYNVIHRLGAYTEQREQDHKGSRNRDCRTARHRFTDEEIIRMRKLFDGGQSKNSLAKLFNCSIRTVFDITERLTYRWLD